MEQFNLNWHTYNDHLKDMMQNLLQSNESTDVTLVCEDKSKFKAHKFVLNACSPVFQSIINDLPQKDPVIYLRGVLAPEMKSILQFMYLGQATFYQDRMNNFLNVAKTLEIKEISKDVNCDAANSSQDQEKEENLTPYDTLDSYEVESFVNQNKADNKVVHKYSSLAKNEAGQYPCNKCDKFYTNKQNLIQHTKSAHEGIKFPCNDCSYKATSKYNLTMHIQAIHERIKISCDLCDFKASNVPNLNAHIKNKHKMM